MLTTAWPVPAMPLEVHMSIQGRRGFRVALPYLLPSLLGALLFALLPIFISLLLSVTNWSGMSRVSLTDGFLKFVAEHFVGLDNIKIIL